MARRNGGFVGQDGLDAPDPPTGVTPTAGNAQVSVAFTAPSNAGTSAITNFVVQLSTDDTAYSAASNTGTSSPIVISSLTNDTAATVKVWAINAYGTSAPSAASASFTPAQLQRAVFGGGSNNVMDFLNIASAGNATDFGNLSASDRFGGGTSSLTRGVFAHGNNSNVIEYITIATAGDATDFGDSAVTFANGIGSCSSPTRGVFGGGYQGAYTNTLNYITIANTGNATDFGDLHEARYGLGGYGSDTRGVFTGGATASATDRSDKVDYITIASTGNAADFGNLNVVRRGMAAASSKIRGIVSGSLQVSAAINSIEYMTIASTGNGTDFGDLTGKSSEGAGAAGLTRALLHIGSNGTNSTTVEFVTIASTGDASDFGDLTVGRSQIYNGTVSSAHGGLQ